MPPRKPSLKRAANTLRTHALTFPEAVEEFPWGHSAFKVRKKVFVFMALEDDHLSLSAKLPISAGAALILPFASPTGYGLGKAGWVTARFAQGETIPVPMLTEWIDESYRTIAPKKLTRTLEEVS